MKHKSKKQEVTNQTFSITNISKASVTSNLKGKRKPKNRNFVPIKFKVHKDLIADFHLLKMDYAKKNKQFALSNNEMFSIMTNFMYARFKQKGLLFKSPEEFNQVVCRKGKRKATHRTVKYPDSEEILFTIEEGIADKYMDIMFSYVKNDKNDNVFSDHHSRTYFFYDFIEYNKKHRKSLLS